MRNKVNFEKMNGLVPAIVQDADEGTVLMLGFMNAEALERTLTDELVTFWSRTKQRLWQKGEISGNHLEVVSIDMDCDKDTLLIRARPRGPVCHTGNRSCLTRVTRRSARSWAKKRLSLPLQRNTRTLNAALKKQPTSSII